MHIAPLVAVCFVSIKPETTSAYILPCPPHPSSFSSQVLASMGVFQVQNLFCNVSSNLLLFLLLLTAGGFSHLFPNRQGGAISSSESLPPEAGLTSRMRFLSVSEPLTTKHRFSSCPHNRRGCFPDTRWQLQKPSSSGATSLGLTSLCLDGPWSKEEFRCCKPAEPH